FGHYDEEQAFGLGLGLFTFRVHFSLENRFTRWFMKKFDKFFYDKDWYDTGRELSLEISTNNISWNLFWFNGVNSRHKWRMGNFYYHKVTDLILGKKIWEEETITEDDTTIDMPEGIYKATYKIEERTYKRERWFKPVSYKSISFDIPAGIPHEGKGENSWDM